MRQELFLKNKISRQIKQNGSHFVFNRFDIDEYGQKTDEIVETFSFDGLFHETISHVHVQLSETDAARIVDVPSSYVLCLFEDGKQIALDDFVEINKNIYRVINKINVGNFNVAYDIMLRMEANGSDT